MLKVKYLLDDSDKNNNVQYRGICFVLTMKNYVAVQFMYICN